MQDRLLDRMPHGNAKQNVEFMSGGLPVQMFDVMLDRIPDRIPEVMSARMIKDFSDKMPHETQQKLLEYMTDRFPDMQIDCQKKVKKYILFAGIIVRKYVRYYVR